MDKGERNELAKKKQKQRLKVLKSTDWMDESQVGKLKNHQVEENCRCSYCISKYNRQKNKKIDLEE